MATASEHPMHSDHKSYREALCGIYEDISLDKRENWLIH